MSAGWPTFLDDSEAEGTMCSSFQLYLNGVSGVTVGVLVSEDNTGLNHELIKQLGHHRAWTLTFVM